MRLDKKLVQTGRVQTRSKALDLIKRGFVKVDGKIIKKPAYNTDSNNIEITKQQIYVARSAEKLIHALDFFRITAKDKICLDIGSSTGGFTQVLLQNKAKKIFAVDVGSNQLHYTLRNVSNIVLLEQTDARTLTKKLIPHPIDLFVSDVSFISITKILCKITHLFNTDTQGIILIKPQFELTVEQIGKGIVKSKYLHRLAISKVKNALEHCGFNFVNLTFSPIKGGSGNIEYLAHIRYKSNTKSVSDKDIYTVVNEAHKKHS